MTKNITKERREAYVEVLEILKHMEVKYVEKVPKKLREFLKENSSKEYVFQLDKSKLLEEQKLKKVTLSLLAMINLNYWCENDEEKKTLLNKYYKNEEKYQDELRQKYNPDNIFKKKNEPIESITYKTEDELIMINQKESLFKRIMNKINEFLKRY